MSSLIEQPADGVPASLESNLAAELGVSLVEDAAPRTAVRYRTLAWLTAAAGLAYLCRNAVGVAESPIREELGLTLEQSGWFMGAFFWTYAIFQVPSGWFSERYGSRMTLSIFALGWSVAMLAMAIAPGFWMLIFAQLAMGVAQAGLLPATVNSIGRWMPIAQRTVACGILSAGMQVGAVAASCLAGLMIEPYGWRWVFVAFALPGIIWTFGYVVWFRDDPSEVLPPDSSELALIRSGRRTVESTSKTEEDELDELWAVVRSSTMWWLCGQQVCRSAGYMFFASWFPTFIQKTRGVSIEKSGYFQGTVLAGTLLGCILGGLLTDWIWRRTGSLRTSRSGVGAASLATCAIVIVGAWFVDTTGLAVFLLAIGAFCAAFAGPCAFAATIDIGGSRVPQVAGLMNMLGNFAAAACPILVGKLFQLTANWNLVLLVFAGVFVAGAVCWLFVNPQATIDSNRRTATN